MNRIDKTFQEMKQKKAKALIAYITAGHPSLEETARLIPAIAEAGADIIEIGVPFSDPTADGPIIQQASQRALQGGANLPAILEMIRLVRQDCQVPLILFSYYNPIHAFGPERFACEAKEAGVDGVLIVDLPPEEARELRCFTEPAGLAFISLLAPTSPEERIGLISRSATGFLYFVSITGVTGTASPDMNQLQRDIARVRMISDIPLAVGFGISTPQQAQEIAPLGDAVVIGSVLVDLIDREAASPDLLKNVHDFVREFKMAVNVPG
ncbi:MAG: tryptophan synthase subunit alpha [Smithellaceae bacterium]|nr:tryptophan synthase subunit alpha [Smithellaceae bacterium]